MSGGPKGRPLTPEIRGYLDKADKYLRSAGLLLREGDVDSAASRLYYSMFYVAEALLLSEGMRFTSHRGVISSFGEKFVKSGRLSPRYHEWLRDAFDKRQYGDYRVLSGLGSADIRLMMDRAGAFLGIVRKMLEDRESGGLPMGLGEPAAIYRVRRVTVQKKRPVKRPKRK